VRECLYNLQHEDYDNSLVKDISWKEVAGEDHASGNEQAHNVLFTMQKL
jgi:hypothetical protein